MKKYVLLTSVLALAACGGGHHHSGNAPLIAPDTIDTPNTDVSIGGGSTTGTDNTNKPNNTPTDGNATTDGNTTTGDNATTDTDVPNTPTDDNDRPGTNPPVIDTPVIADTHDITTLPAQVDNRAEVIAYVESKLGDDYYVIPQDGASGADTARNAAVRQTAAQQSRRTLTLDEKYEQARAKLDAMNETLSRLFDQTDKKSFVSQNAARVEEALKLFGETVTSGQTVDKIVAICENIVADGIGHAKEKLEQIREQNALKRWNIEDVNFLVATPSDDGNQSILKLKVNQENRITDVTVFDDMNNLADFEQAKRIGDSSRFELPRVYSYILPIFLQTRPGFDCIEFDSDKDLSLQDIKQQFLDTGLDICTRLGCDEEEIAEITAKIDRLTAADRNAEDDYGINTGFIATSEQSVVDIYTQGGDLKMKYADFGYAVVETNSRQDDYNLNEETYEAFAGGYDAKTIDKHSLHDEKVFVGRAVGGIRYETLDWTDKNTKWDGQLLTTDDAKLTFKDGIETLNMNFTNDGWYNVTVTSKDGKSDILFTGEDQVTDGNFKFQTASVKDYTAGTGSYGDAGVIGKFHTAYYGDGGIASEATAIVGFRETIVNEDGTGREVEFNSAFGGKID